MGELANRPSNEEMKKSTKPYLQYWKKTGVTPEERRQDSVECGSIDPSHRREPDSEPHFTNEQINAEQLRGDQSTIITEGRLRRDWQKCMIKKGYRCTEEWMLLP